MTARQMAMEILAGLREGRGFAAELIDEHLRRNPLSDRDRRLLTELVLGVLRHTFGLEALLRPFVRRGLDEVQPDLLDVLFLGTYQIAHLDQVPDRAAVSESVELAKRINPKAGGLVNGVLRRVSEVVTDRLTPSPAADALPLSGGRFRQLRQPLLPDPVRQPAGYLSDGYTWPPWLAERWLGRFGWDECLRLGNWFGSPPAVWLRANLLRTDRAALIARLQEAGINAEPGEHPQAVRLIDRRPIRDLPGYDAGDFCVQDLSAMAVASDLAPEPGWRVLDLCAAPGGKTTHLAELMRNTGEIVACDSDPDRLRTVEELAGRLGISNVRTVAVGATGDGIPDGPFDAALVDVPCGNTGVIGRRPEVRHRLGPNDLRELAVIQKRLLNAAIDRVRPGGVVVYSTCSIEPEENVDVVRAVSDGRADVTCEGEWGSNPGRPADGGYRARLCRR